MDDLVGDLARRLRVPTRRMPASKITVPIPEYLRIEGGPEEQILLESPEHDVVDVFDLLAALIDRVEALEKRSLAPDRSPAAREAIDFFGDLNAADVEKLCTDELPRSTTDET